VIKKLPKCLHTCLHCKHAVISEEYSRYSRKLVYDGCWIHDNLTLPVNRGDCDKFEESIERVQRKFWKKWNWKVYINGDLVTLEQPEPEEKESGGLFERDEIHTEQVTGNHTEIYDRPAKQQFKRADEIHEQGTTQGCGEGDQPESSSPNVATPTTTTSPGKKNTTRVLIQQALSNKISRLKDIAHFAEVDPSTAHYHLRNLIKEGRVIRTSWGHYTFSDPDFLGNNGKTFEKLLKNFSQSIGEKRELHELHSLEKNILMDILSKDNKYERFSERKLARRNSISRYSVRKYTEELEKSKLIIIKREKNQFVYLPTELAIKGLTDFFQSLNTGSKVDSSSSKIQPPNPGVQPIDPVDSHNPPHLSEDTSLVQPTSNVLETFDEYIAWQQKNAHRLFIQFKLLHCNHSRLKKTGWIFGEKSIRKHFAEAYIFKSKDPKGHFINVLPKNPIIFFSPFEFEEKIVTLINDIIDRLRQYQIVIDLSEPAEVKMAHVALEDDVFARKVIEKGLLYFRSKVVTIDSTDERITYVIKIDKSKSLHLEFEGTEALKLTENLEAFVDDVVTGRIDRKKLREIPQTVDNLKEEFGREIHNIGERLDTSIRNIGKTQELLHQNQVKITENLVSCMEIVKKISEASESMAWAAHTIQRDVELLAAGSEREECNRSYISSCS
jgi:predicted transcriptional regulator